MDVRDLRFENESFDVAIDKGSFSISLRHGGMPKYDPLQVPWMQ